MTGLTNEQRIADARFALASYLWANGGHPQTAADSESVIDLLSDLRHFCQANGIDYAECDHLAASHFAAEQAEADRGCS